MVARAEPATPRRRARGARGGVAGTALAATLAAASAGSAPAPAPAAPPLCAASVALEPDRAYPGQQVLFRLRVLARADVSDLSWEEPPSFPGLRAERLTARPVAGEVERGGAVYQVREDLRALFADRPGRVAIPGARILCRARGPGRELSARTQVPDSALEVLPLPEAGRGVDFRGLVGPLWLRRTLTPDRVVPLGQSVRVALTLQGGGSLWDAAEPELRPEALGGAEVFRRPAELELDRGERLLVRRRFAFDIVPRRQGVLRIPAFAWTYFDPASLQYEQAVVEATEIEVGPPAPPAASAEPAARAPIAREPGGRADLAPVGATARLVAGAALAAALGAAGWLAWRRRRARAAPAREALARADAARAAGDRDGELTALASAVRAALAARTGAGPELLWSSADGLPEAILAGVTAPGARQAAEILASLERARFDPAAEPPGREAILRALAALGVRAPEIGRGDGRQPR